ncbi:MAG: DNA polymerase III subunit gamma/tau [Bacilli bacterium]
MGYLALYRKYRPVDFNSVYGQEHVVTILKNAIISGKISHAYLFSGPRGTGKTTVAKIIARLVNCENLVDGNPCGKCYNCINYMNSSDIVEIDAASNNGVDEIRELKDKINLVPSNAKYKIYIIDEVHMLTTQAFNALLKTLEEPPSHVIFVLATTEPHKIPLTISSRCQKFRFSKIEDSKIVNRLSEICKLENIIIDEDALFEIARLSDGGMRDAINFLDQLIAYSSDNITIEDVYNVNGSVSYADLYYLLNSIIINDKIKIIEFIDNFDESGKDINKFIEEMIIFLKDVILYKNANISSNISIKNEYINLIANKYNDSDLYDLIENLNLIQNSVKFSSHSAILFLTSILKYSDLKFKNSDSSFVDSINFNVKNDNKNISREIISNKNINIQKNNDYKEKSFGNGISENEINLRINNALALASKNILENFKSKWEIIDNYIDNSEFSVVSGLLKDSKIVVGSDKFIILSSDFQSVVDRINNSLKDVERLLEKIFGSKIFVVAVTNNKWKDIKIKYITDINSGIKYSVKELYTDDNDIKEKSSIDELIDLVGENMIEYK